MPLNYVIEENVAAIAQINTNFLDDYIDRTPLTRIVFNANAPKVRLYIALLIFENTIAEQKLRPHNDAADGCFDCFALQKFYEEVQSNAKSVLTVKKDIQELFYRGENPSHMWWDKFEVKLTSAIPVIDKNEDH